MIGKPLSELIKLDKTRTKLTQRHVHAFSSILLTGMEAICFTSSLAISIAKKTNYFVKEYD